MNIQLSELAAAKLKLLLYQECSPSPLAVRVIPLTSGCSTPTLALELTEIHPHFETAVEQGITFAWKPNEVVWMDGLVIDLNRENGKFSIYHPHPPSISNCPFESNL